MFGDDVDVLTDLMVMYHDTRDFARADSLADQIIFADSTIPFPYAIKGHIAEVRGQNRQAIRLYEEFIAMAPNDPDTPNIRKRLNELVLQQQQP
jgi:regulator of sirC expression with transglutaminase-like and TPR domain